MTFDLTGCATLIAICVAYVVICVTFDLTGCATLVAICVAYVVIGVFACDVQHGGIVGNRATSCGGFLHIQGNISLAATICAKDGRVVGSIIAQPVAGVGTLCLNGSDTGGANGDGPGGIIRKRRLRL